jgi:MFS family permease
MQTVAQSWLVYRLTGSGLKLGAVGFASQIPVFLFAPLGGIVADRSNRKHVVIGGDVDAGGGRVRAYATSFILTAASNRDSLSCPDARTLLLIFPSGGCRQISLKTSPEDNCTVGREPRVWYLLGCRLAAACDFVLRKSATRPGGRDEAAADLASWRSARDYKHLGRTSC